ncbi:DUF1376 domain-containing protein [Piscinibacter sakaiensis]|uniref:DUF1376 domain-containing protein n=1 Tax=Piscinibacter sakaiensis TaxID=1547922 RepID=A0A0K8P441_PISS1|nr:DUF1376 domain-containing protein [Piscinibacter sakaiensis]GAP37366.1 hypothetical protein ISF6_3221 [Piscinibacter sakaiensis]
MTHDADLPEPLVPAEVDLRGLEYMPLLGAKLFTSDFNLEASDAEFRAALTLWWAAWNQQPAASLPAGERSQAKLAGFEDETSAKWRKVRTRVLHGFVLCSDGRLYHPVLARQALIAWEKRGEEREERENEADRQRRSRAERKRMFAELRAVGVTPKWDIPMSDLRRIHAEAVPASEAPAAQPVTPPVTGHDTPPVTVTGHGEPSRPVTVTDTAKTGRDGTLEEEQHQGRADSAPPPRRARGPDDDPPRSDPTPAGRIGLALRRGGMPPTAFQPSDPRVIALAEEGYAEDQVEDVAREAVRKGKGFPWVVATLRGRRADAQAIAAAPGAAPAPDWRTDRNEVIRRGVELGLGPYAALDDRTGHAVPWDTYRRRVIAAHDAAARQGAPA